MENEITLYDKALSNFKSACILRNNLNDDENHVNIIAYLLQQSLELALKYQLEQNAVEYPKTHDIDQLVRIGRRNHVNFHLTEYLEDHTEMFSQWESKSRYILGFLVEINRIDKAISGLAEYYRVLAKL